MLHAGLDLSRQRLDVHVLDEDGRTVEVTAVRPDGDALRTLVGVIGRHGQEVTATIESMNGARFVHNTLELLGWDVEIADAVKVKGLAPLAAKTDRIDARVLAELGRRDLVPAIWLPDPAVRAERERARFRLHLVRHRTAFEEPVHATLMAFGHPVAVSDLFGGVAGRELLASLEVPEPWATTLATSLRFVDELDAPIDECEQELRAMGADHPDVELLRTAPGIAWVLGYTIASEIGDIQEVYQSQEVDRIHRAVPIRPPVGWEVRSRASSPRTDPSSCAGRSSRRRPTRPVTRRTRSGTSATSAASAASAGPRSPGSTSPASSPPPSGTCSPSVSPSLPAGPT